MKPNIHPAVRKVVFQDASTGKQFILNSTATSKENFTLPSGEVCPLVKVEVTSDSHPFYTGKQRFANAEGRIEKFNKKYGL